MNKKQIYLCLLFSIFFCTFPLHIFGKPSVYDLQINNVSLGTDTSFPLCFSWKTYNEQRGYKQTAYQIVLSSYGNTIWDSGKVSSDESVLVPYKGDTLKASTPYSWKVKVWSKAGESEWSSENPFITGLFTDKDWQGAKWIALEKDRPDWYLVPAAHVTDVDAKIKDKNFGFYKLPKFKQTFKASKKVRLATAYVCGLGHFELSINGQKIGDDFLDPGWTKYEKEAMYVTFDVTRNMRIGKNEINVMLGNGFYNIPRVGYYKLVGSFGAPKLRMLLRIEYEDGKVNYVVTDKHWLAAQSPITRSSIYSGEDYDATMEQIPWKKAIITSYPGRLKAQQNPPLKVHEEIAVKRIIKDKKGGFVYDLGQNFSGIIYIKVKGGKGQKVSFVPGELLNADSCVSQGSTGGPYTFSYVLNGNGDEEWKPRFSYFGFRYVQLENAVPKGEKNPDNLPVVEELIGLHTCSSAQEVGTFTCSNRLFNQTYELIDWAMRSNMASVLTDCPHREKLGWLEEAHLMQYSLQYRYNLNSLYRKIMDDMELSQEKNGQIPCIAPRYTYFNNACDDSPEWGSTFIISPWYVYKWYGDKTLLAKHYPAMKRMVSYLESRADKDGIVAYGLGDWFDIGPNSLGQSQLTSKGVTATAMYFYNTEILAKTAILLNLPQDAKLYQEKARKIKEDFNKRYLNPDGSYDRNSQCANAMALFMGLVPEDKKEAVLNHLIQDIRSRENALTAGDVGYRYLVQALRENNCSQIIYDMNSRYDVPGYGWQLNHGATALTESWQAYAYASNNHLMLGHLMEWFFNGLGGINQTDKSIAWKEVSINPQLVSGVNHASTSYVSPYGKITCNWKILDGVYTLEVDIPANSSAIVHLPTDNVNNVSEYGTPLNSTIGIENIKIQDKELLVKVGSGHYRFICNHFE